MKKFEKVWINGSFDVLHLGHIDLLKYAKSIGNHLTVAIDSDRMVKESKGSKRPINISAERKEFLESIRYVDKVLIFDSHEEMKKQILDNKIDAVIVGEDHKEDQVIGSDFVQVVKYKKRIKKSTTSILKTYYKESPPF